MNWIMTKNNFQMLNLDNVGSIELDLCALGEDDFIIQAYLVNSEKKVEIYRGTYAECQAAIKVLESRTKAVSLEDLVRHKRVEEVELDPNNFYESWHLHK